MDSPDQSRELAVIVGATGTLGAVIAQRLLQEGLDVLAVGRRESELQALASRHANVSICVADISDDSAVQALKAAVRKRVRIAVNAAGVPTAGGVLEVSTSALVEAVNIKSGGMLRLMRGVDDYLERGSRLVAIGGHYGFEPTAYAATAGVANASLVNLMRQLSWGLGGRGVTAHLVAPGPADSERLKNVARSHAQHRGVSIETVLEEMRADSAIGSLTTPDQVAWAIALLLSAHADALAGSSLMLDCGRRRGLP